MRFRFNELKTAQAAAYLLKLHGGRLNYMVLIKLLYLADREMLLRQGRPITGDRLVSMRHGPVLSRVLEFINEGPREGQATPWFDYVGDPTGYDVTLKQNEATDELSRYELKLLGEVHEKFGRMDKWALVDLLHAILPEWKDPGLSSAPIAPVDIFRAADRPQEEIDLVHADAEAMWFARSLVQ